MYERKVPPTLHVSIKFVVIVMAKDVSQLASVAMLPPRLLMLTGRISDIMSHGMAPIPNEKVMTKDTIPTREIIVKM